MIKYLALIGSTLFLFGCESLSPYGEAHTGGAVYHYENTVSADGVKKCLVNGTTAKEVPGVEIEITDTCGLKVHAAGSSPVGDAFGAIRTMADKMPDLSGVSVAP